MSHIPGRPRREATTVERVGGAVSAAVRITRPASGSGSPSARLRNASGLDVPRDGQGTEAVAG